MAGSITYVTQVQSTTNQSTHTFNTTSIGTAAADRVLCIGVAAITNGGNRTPTLTVDGNSATRAVSQNGANDGGGNNALASLFVIAWPSNTTADIVVAMGGDTFDCTVWVYAANGIDISSPVTSTSATDGAT